MNHMYDIIEDTRQRSELYFGERISSFSRIHDFLGGFEIALYKLNANKYDSLLPLPFWFFHEYVANSYNYNESTAGWYNIILKETNNNEGESLLAFYKLFDSFKALKIENCYISELNERNIEHHYKNEYAPRRVISNREEPLYKNPLATYLIELSCNSGYICLIKTETEYRSVCRIYKYDRDIKLYLKSCFGDIPKWERVQIDNFPFDKQLLLN